MQQSRLKKLVPLQEVAAVTRLIKHNIQKYKLQHPLTLQLFQIWKDGGELTHIYQHYNWYFSQFHIKLLRSQIVFLLRAFFFGHLVE